MNKAKVLLILAFVVVCAAGAVVGTAVDRHVRPSVAVPFDLDLTPAQAQQMKAIWDEVGKIRHEIFSLRRQLERERRDDFEKLLTPDQLTQYKKIQQDYDAKFKALDEQFRQAAHDADMKSRQLLTPAQLAKYDAIRAKMGPPGMGPPPGMGRPGMGAPGMGGPGHPHHDHDHDHDHDRFHPGPPTAPSAPPDTGPT